MKISHLLEDKKLPGAFNGVKVMSPEEFVSQSGDEEVDADLSEDNFGMGPGGPREPAGPIGAGPDRVPNTGVPDKENYKAPLSDKYDWKPGSAMGGWDAAGQQKYIDRTSPGIINKIKDKLGIDMPDNDYGPRPDERERLVKRYPAPTKESKDLLSRKNSQ